MRLKLVAGFLVAPLAFFALTAMSYRADFFSINFPDGWTAPEKTPDGLYVTKSLDGAANCNASSVVSPDYAGKSHQELNEALPGMTLEDWADHFAVPASQITVKDDEKRHVGDLWLHVATFTVAPGGSIPQQTMFRYALVLSPGRINMAGCYAAAADFPAYAAIFEAVVSSLRPL